MSTDPKPYKGCWQDPHVHKTEGYEPARNLPRSACAITGLYYSIRNGRQVAHESYMERNVIDCLEQADLTWRYYEQPVSIIFKDERFKSREFTPDLLWYGKPPTEKYKRIRPVLIEVKPVRQLFAWGAMNRERVDAAKLEADRQGWQFVFVTDGEIRPPEALIHWLNSQVPVDMDPLQVRLIDFLDQVGPTNLMSAAMHLKGLVGGLEPASDVVGRLISEGIIEYIDREPVTWWSKIQLRGQTLAELATAAGKVSHD